MNEETAIEVDKQMKHSSVINNTFKQLRKYLTFQFYNFRPLKMAYSQAGQEITAVIVGKEIITLL